MSGTRSTPAGCFRQKIAEDGWLTLLRANHPCGPWTDKSATGTIVNDGFNSAKACKVCLTATGVSGGVLRTYGKVTPGRYVVSAHVKNISSTDARITIDRELRDGGAEAFYLVPSVPFGSNTGWMPIQLAADTAGNLAVLFWFGGEFKAGDCALVDEIVVTKSP